MNDVELAYAAGFFDGEGHIRIQAHSNRSRCMMLQVQLTQSTLDPLDWFVRTFGGTVIKRLVPYKNEKKLQYNWQASSMVAEKFLKALRPYLRTKADEADVALEFRARSGMHYGNRRLPAEEVAAREVLAARLKSIRKIKRDVHAAGAASMITAGDKYIKL